MNDSPRDDLLSALRALPREEAPPPELEARILAALRRERLLARRPRWVRLAAAAALLAVTFVSGYAAGNVRSEDPLPITHILLVYPSPPDAPGDDDSRAAEYGRWARGLARERKLVGGAELTKDALLLDRTGAVPEGQPEIGGYFLLHADSDVGAREIAATCPHLRYGGRLELRRVRR